jgi:hypothetical protein
LKKIHKEARVISMPNVYTLPKCFFPQYSQNNVITFKNKTFFFRDKIIDDNFLKGKSINHIISIYKDKDYFNKKLLNSQFDEFIKKVIERENDWDIKVSKFILKNYQNHQLFYDPNHPTVYFLEYIAIEIMKLLEIDIQLIDNQNHGLINPDLYEIPIHNSIKEAFNLNYNISEIRSSGRKLIKVKMGFEEYIRQYIYLAWNIKEYPSRFRIKSIFILFLDLVFKGRIIHKFIKNK